MDDGAQSLLAVHNLDVVLAASRILSGVSFNIEPGRIAGLFGESGCGKSTLALALLGLLPEKYRVAGSVQFEGKEIIGCPPRELRRIRGAGMAIVFQDPLLALNPVLRAEDQIAEAIRAHSRAPAAAVRMQVATALKLVGLDPSRVARAYPHEISGGQRQRVLLAQALASKARLIIADEPFSALDAPAAVELCSLFLKLRDELATSFLLISHSPGVLAVTADRVMVMNHGQLVECGPARQVLSNPNHPHTAALLRSAHAKAEPRG